MCNRLARHLLVHRRLRRTYPFIMRECALSLERRGRKLSPESISSMPLPMGPDIGQ